MSNAPNTHMMHLSQLIHVKCLKNQRGLLCQYEQGRDLDHTPIEDQDLVLMEDLGLNSGVEQHNRTPPFYLTDLSKLN